MSDPVAHRLDDTRRVDADRDILRPVEAFADPGDVRLAPHHVPVEGVHRGRSNSNEDLVGTDSRPVDVRRLQDFRSAISIADAEGIEALTMRRLAQELAVEAMSLYHYFPSKSDVLDWIVDLVVSEFELPPPDVDWKAALRTTAISAHAILVRHPWAANLMLSGEIHEARLRYMDAVLGCLRRGGFSADMTHHAYHALDSHILGFTLWQVGIATAADAVPDVAGSFLAELPRTTYPHLAEHIEQHLSETAASGATEFEFGLDLILDGLERSVGGDSDSQQRIGGPPDERPTGR
jgi:AcrR family transcriptional regulator